MLSSRHRRLIGVSATAAVILLSSCQDTDVTPQDPAGRKVAEGTFGALAWTEEGMFSVVAGTEEPPTGYTGLATILDDGGTEPLEIQQREGCRLNLVGTVATSLDHELVYTTNCTGPESAPGEQIFDVRSLDPKTGRDRPLADGLTEGIGGVSWDPATAQGFAELGDSRCTYIVRVEGDGLEPFAVTSTVGGVTWFNDPDEQALSVDGCSTNGANAAPSLSPDGRQVAFFGRPPGDDQSWALLLASPAGGRARVLETGFLDPAIASWSPDGTRLAIVAGREDAPERAVWLLDLDSLELELMVSPASGAIAWSPGGDELVIGSTVGPLDFPQLIALTIYAVPETSTTNGD